MMSASQDAPFRAIVSPNLASEALVSPAGVSTAASDAWSPEELEAAYQRALEAAELADQLVAAEMAPEAGGQESPALPSGDAGAAVGSESMAADELRPDVDKPAPQIARPSVAPRQVLEALLFVGGEPLTGKRLADLLGGGFTHEQVDELIADLNRQYADEGRPYEVRLAEGGYRLELAPEYEPVRSRVYGLGPKDVKLSQDALEVLAFVAYQQPVNKEAVEETGKANAGAILRQLLQRELIALERTGEEEQVRYRTTKRFLDLFGLRDIEDLPQPDDLMFK
jgi:segregation and condensation protein B